MQDKKNTNLVIVGIVILAVAVACYFYVTRDQSPTDLLTGETAGVALSVDGDLISALSSLRRLKMDDSIFANPVWLSLTDFGQTLSPQPSGRPNPFAPFEGAATAATPPAR